MKKVFLGMIAICSTMTAIAAEDSTYTGKIKSIYSHEREQSTPYFGIELEGNMNANPCGTNLSYYIKQPSEVSDQHMSMLLMAHAAGKTVTIKNQDASQEKKCHVQFSTFNFVKVHND